MSRRSKKISCLQKDNKFLKYVVERAHIEIDKLKIVIRVLKAME